MESLRIIRLALWLCAALVMSGWSTGGMQQAQALTISGRVLTSAGDPVPGVKIESTGDVNDGIFTNADGYYTLTGAAPGGTYTITPELEDTTFTPPSRTVNVGSSNVVSVNFIASGGGVGVFSISGRVINSSGIGVAGVRIESTGEVNDGVLTNANGFYTLTGAAPGTYTITPDRDNTAFNPATRNATVNNTNVTGIDFVAFGGGAGVGGLTISGRVTNSAGAGVAGVRIESTGEVLDGVLTNTDGFYTLTGVAPGTYIITPDRDNTAFTPAARQVQVSSTSLTGVNFTASAGVANGSFTISGRVINSSGAGVPGVRIESSGEVNDGILTNADGYYTLTGVAPGTYIITPDRDNTAFNPTARQVQVTTANRGSINFVALGGGAGTGQFTISGRVITSNGVGVPGVRIESTGEVNDGILTNAEGYYTLTGVAPGTYIITPDRNNTAFNPTARSVQVTTANRVSINFIATPQ